MRKKQIDPRSFASTPLQQHFKDLELSELVTARRLFPPTARCDLQRALDDTFSTDYEAHLLGLHRSYQYGGLQFSDFLDLTRDPILIAPLQHDEIDIGDPTAARCLKQGLWMCRSEGLPFAVLLAHAERYGESEGVAVEIAVPSGQAGLKLSHSFLDGLEKLVSRAGCYRGKVISLEAGSRYSGKAGVVKVHKLHSVDREDVILPAQTLKLLERNVTDFIQQRDRLRVFGMQVKKGLLFYGRPGTGKTHTIHYLASELPDHTTLLITAGQVAFLEEYFLLARFLQPAMVVIEDVDLIARDRESMGDPCAESLLNRLLNEMDGLREDAAVLFVLTTNRPEHLEAALASRPGRIDQAIEFPLPDDEGRRKLVRLYGRNLVIADELLDDVVRRTHGASPAFIKELMRRSAQCLIRNDKDEQLQREHIDLALDEMLFSGGTLNVKLLGGMVGERQ